MGHKTCKIELTLCFTTMLCDSSTSGHVKASPFDFPRQHPSTYFEEKFSQTHTGPRGLRAQFKADSLRSIKMGKLKQTCCSPWPGGLRPFSKDRVYIWQRKRNKSRKCRLLMLTPAPSLFPTWPWANPLTCLSLHIFMYEMNMDASKGEPLGSLFTPKSCEVDFNLLIYFVDESMVSSFG